MDGDKMEITIKERSIVRPAKDTPKGNLRSSSLDLVVQPYHVSLIYFYKPNGSSNFFEAQVLKKALSEVLVPFYPLAGRLGRDENGRIHINCNSHGVLFIEAQTSSLLDDFGDFTPTSHMLHLLPSFDDSMDISSFPLFAVQVTHLGGGGACLGVRFHHTAGDGTSVFHFINSWSNIARGTSISIPPLIDRTLLDARVPPTPTFHHSDYDPPPRMMMMMNTQDSKPTSTKLLKITPDQLITLKSKFKESKYSTYETLAAHIWHCVCKARDLRDDQETKLYMPVNGRSRFVPPLPLGYFGNVMFRGSVLSTAGEIQSQPLAHTMERIHKSLMKMNDGYLRSALAYLEMHPDLTTALVAGAHIFNCPNLNVISWTSLPVYDADFGWGRPIFMGPTRVNVEGKAYILPSPNNDKSLSLVIRLQTHHMESFHKLFYELLVKSRL